MNRTLLFVIIGAAVLGVLLYIFSAIVVYFVIAGIITAVLTPLVDRLDQVRFLGFHFPRIFAVIISFGVLVGVVMSFFSLFVPLVEEQIAVIQDMDHESLTNDAMGFLGDFEDFLVRHGVGEEMQEGFVVDWLDTYWFEIFSSLEFEGMLDSVVSFTGSLVIALIAVLFMSFFFLMEKGLVRNLILGIIPNGYFEFAISAYYKVRKLLSNYLAGLLIQCTMIFTVVALLLTILGVKYALTIAVFSAIANLIPYLGPVLGAIFGILVSLTTATIGDESESYLVLVGKILLSFGAVKLIDNIFLQPVIFSKSVKAHPLEIFVIIFVGATLAGPLGMIAAIPCYTVVRVFFTEFYRGLRKYRVFTK